MLPTRAQIATTREVVRWYLATHYGSEGDFGLLATFTSVDRVGSFAVERGAIERGDPDALFRLLLTVAMFQRLRDTHVMGILRRVPPDRAQELTDLSQLIALTQSAGCAHAKTPEGLAKSCSLTKDARTGRGICDVAPSGECFLHRHTELVRRYGHFGKMPAAAALVVERAGGDLTALRRRVLAATPDPLARSQQLVAALSEAWRIGDKIACMFLSLLAVPDLGHTPPWADGLDSSWFVVVDQNVDAFLASIGYGGDGSYTSRRQFIRSIADRIDLSALSPRLAPSNARLVQQAMYLFMSRANRSQARNDCSRLGANECRRCPRRIASRCPVAVRPTAGRA